MKTDGYAWYKKYHIVVQNIKFFSNNIVLVKYKNIRSHISARMIIKMYEKSVASEIKKFNTRKAPVIKNKLYI